ncbi:MAG TPA: hypothetical protein VK530_20675, partial [Candidatus Acidoferrum sp.]|nr:hypothetical protein [Candidatus Acidoferrum sp.]
AVSGKSNQGEVVFDKISENKTRVTVRIAWEPDGAMEKVAGTIGLASARVKGDLKRFKDFIERRGQESGAWRGEIHGEQVSLQDQSTARSKRFQEVPGATAPGTPSTTPGGASGKL